MRVADRPAWRPGLLAFAAGLAVSCNMGIEVDPQGYACDPNNACPAKYVCRDAICRSIVSVCAATTCDSPPNPVCANQDSLQVYDSPGSCSDVTGQCIYPTHLVSCPLGCEGTGCLP